MSRVIAYVDGFNLYFGLRSSGFRRYYWLDLNTLCTTFLLPGQTLEHVHYFTARIRSNGTNGPDRARQSNYLDALATLPRFTSHERHFLSKPAKCHSCKNTWTTYEEKQSDVNLAVQLLLDAMDNNFDTAIVVSGDSDLSTPVSRVLQRFPGKQVVVAFPPKRNSAQLAKIASGSFKIGESSVRKSQLPDPVLTASGVALARPPEWK